MKNSWSSGGILVIAAAVCPRALAAPIIQPLIGGADACAAPDVISGTGTFVFDTTSATTGAQGQAQALCLYAGTTGISSDVWFTWTSAFSGSVTLSTCNQTTVDTKIAIYSGSSCPAGAAIACNDDACSSVQSGVTWTAALGTAYLIQIGSAPASSAGGFGTFTISASAPPSNDNCATPTSINGAGPFAWDNTFATTGAEGQTERICRNASMIGIDKDVWFVWTASFTGTAEARTCGLTNIDTKMAVYPGSACPTSGSALDCDDDSCGPASLQSLVDFPCVLGSTYMIQIGSQPGSGGGTGGVGIAAKACPAPPGDVCSQSERKLGGCATKKTDTACAGASMPDPSTGCGGGGSGNDVWYSWSTPTSGSYDFKVCGSGVTTPGYSPRIALYAAPTGMSCPGANLACGGGCGGGQSILAFSASANTAYMIQIGGDFSGALGGALLSITSNRCNDRCDEYDVIDEQMLGEFSTTGGTTGMEGQSNGLCTQGGNSAIEHDLWWAFVPVCSGTAQVTTCGLTAVDTKIAVYDGLSCPGSPAIACNDDACGAQSNVTWSAVAGHAYTIQIGNAPGTATGSGQFQVSCSSGVAFCFGDGSGTACPCGNAGAPGNGCANSVDPSGANLASTGTASIAADTVVLRGTGLPSSGCLYFQATATVAGGSGSVFGDGLRCASGSVIRLGTKITTAGTSQYPGPGDSSVSVRGGVSAGNVRHYQAWYRNAAAFCTTSTFNLSNGVSLTWMP